MTGQKNLLDDYIQIALAENIYKDTPFLKIRSYTDFPERFEPGNSLFFDFFGQMKELKIDECVREKNNILISIVNFSQPEQAKVLAGKSVYIKKSDRKQLPEGSYYVHELIGSRVLASDESLGIIQDVMLLPANDVYVVAGDKGGEILVPALKEIIEDFNPGEKLLRLKVRKDYFGDEV